MTTPVSTNLQKNVTLKEYFELDLASDEKLEYWNGNVRSMSGASLKSRSLGPNHFSSHSDREVF